MEDVFIRRLVGRRRCTIWIRRGIFWICNDSRTNRSSIRRRFTPLTTTFHREQNQIREQNEARNANLKLVHHPDGVVDVMPLEDEVCE